VIPWEDPSRPLSAAFLETIRAFVTSPRRAFERVPVHGDVLRPLMFAILVGWIGQFVYAVWEVTVGEGIRAMLPSASRQDVPRVYWFAVMALAPLFTAISLVVSSAITHLFLMLYGGARSGFVATFRALCYVQVGALALIVPFCGAIFGGLIVLALEIIGLATMHRISYGKSAAAVLTPTLLCCMCVAIVLVFAGAAAWSALGGLTP
jgi:hypothetical protein